jgi:tetratricopeptide (TPR) repeat protein
VGARARSFNYHGPMKKIPGLVLALVWMMAGGLARAQTPATPPAAPTSPAEAPAPAGLAQARAAQDNAPRSQLDAQLLYQLLIGELTVQQGEPGAGYALILDAARKTGDAQLYQRATDIALQSRSGDAALQAATAWKQAQPASREANRYVLQILIALNRITETVEPLRAEVRMAPEAERSGVIAAIPRIYARVSDKKLAALTVEEALAPSATNPGTASAAWTAIARMRLAAEDSNGALDAAKRGQAASTGGDERAEGPVLVALELMDPQRPEAEALVRRYFEGNPKALPEIRMGYARALLDARRYAEASAQLQIVTRDKPDYPEGWLVLGSLQLQDNQLAPAQTSLERYIALVQQQASEAERSRGLAQAYLALSQVAEKRKDYTAAEAWLAKIDNPADLVQAQTRRASILASRGKLEEGRAVIRQLPERNANDARLKISAEVSLLREFKQYRAAYDVLAGAIAKTPDDVELLYDQSMLAEKLDSLDEMERLLRRVIAIKPDYHHAYNALGYSLADRGVRLQEARELIRKALTFAPSDPFIRDSLGWVEFRLGNKTEALKVLEAAYKARPDAEIAAHLGEVLWSLGQRDRATVIWKEGQLLNPTNDTLLETLKRLRVKL